MDETEESRVEKLREQQAQIARRERRAAEEAPNEDDAQARERRAEKAAYLASKLAKREQSELE